MGGPPALDGDFGKAARFKPSVPVSGEAQGLREQIAEGGLAGTRIAGERRYEPLGQANQIVDNIVP